MRCTQGAQTAYGAVAKPVEGTILTVIRESAAAAVETAGARQRHRGRARRRRSPPPRRSVARTPSLLRDPARGRRRRRRRPGPVPPVPGRAAAPRRARRPVGAAREPRRPPDRRPSTLVAHADEGFGYETMFLLQAAGHRPLDVDAIRDHLESIGESVLVAGDARALKVHVHNERPDLVIGYGLALGDAEPDQRREPRQPGARRPRDPGSRVHRRRHRPSERAHHRPAGRLPASRVATDADRLPTCPTWRSSRSPPATDWPRSSATSGSHRSSRAASRQTRAPASCWRPSGSPAPGRSCSFRTTRTSSSPRARSRPMTRAARPGRADSERRRRFRRAARARSRARRRRQRRPDDRGRPRRSRRRRHRGGARRHDRRQEGEARPDDRPRSGRRARSRSTVTGRSAVLAAMTALTPGYELVTLFYGDGADLAEAEAMARRIGDGRARHRGRGPARRPALLPVSDLGRVAGLDGAKSAERLARSRRPHRPRPIRSSCSARRWPGPG